MELEERAEAEGKKWYIREELKQKERKRTLGKSWSLINRNEQLILSEAYMIYLSLNSMKLKMKVDSEAVEN